MQVAFGLFRQREERTWAEPFGARRARTRVTREDSQPCTRGPPQGQWWLSPERQLDGPLRALCAEAECDLGRQEPGGLGRCRRLAECQGCSLEGRRASGGWCPGCGAALAPSPARPSVGAGGGCRRDRVEAPSARDPRHGPAMPWALPGPFAHSHPCCPCGRHWCWPTVCQAPGSVPGACGLGASPLFGAHGRDALVCHVAATRRGGWGWTPRWAPHPEAQQGFCLRTKWLR